MIHLNHVLSEQDTRTVTPASNCQQPMSAISHNMHTVTTPLGQTKDLNSSYILTMNLSV